MKKFGRQKSFISAVLFLCILLTGSLVAAEDLVAVICLTRHGDRTPFEQIKNSPVNWPDGNSGLTALGMSQHFNLGLSLRHKYIDGIQFMSSQYQSDSIFAQSSDNSRTIMSADCLLAGLYPPGTGPLLADGRPALPYSWQVIPVRTVPADSAAIMVPYPRYLQIMNNYVYNQPEWQAKEQSLQPKFAEWSRILGNDVKGLSDVMAIGDVLIVRDKHGINLPTGLDREEADQIIALTDWALAYEFRSPKVSALCGGELLAKIAASVNDTISGKSNYKFILYSGHDISILPVMTLLGQTLQSSPGYAAHMELEIYKADSGYIIKLLYNNNEMVQYSIAEFNDWVKKADSLMKN